MSIKHCGSGEHCEIMYKYGLFAQLGSAGCAPEIKFSSTAMQGVHIHMCTYTSHKYLPSHLKGKN